MRFSRSLLFLGLVPLVPACGADAREGIGVREDRLDEIVMLDDGSGASDYKVVGEMRGGDFKVLPLPPSYFGPMTGGVARFTLTEPSDVIVSAAYGSMGGPRLFTAAGAPVATVSVDPPNSYYRFVRGDALAAGTYLIALRTPIRSMEEVPLGVTLGARPASPEAFPPIPVEGHYTLTEVTYPGTSYSPQPMSTPLGIRHSADCVFQGGEDRRGVDCYRIDVGGDGLLTPRHRLRGGSILVAIDKYGQGRAYFGVDVLGGSSVHDAAADAYVSIGRARFSGMTMTIHDPIWGDRTYGHTVVRTN